MRLKLCPVRQIFRYLETVEPQGRAMASNGTNMASNGTNGQFAYIPPVFSLTKIGLGNPNLKSQLCPAFADVYLISIYAKILLKNKTKLVIIELHWLPCDSLFWFRNEQSKEN